MQPPLSTKPGESNIIAFNNITRGSYSTGGLLIAANSVNEDTDILLIAAPDIGRVARAVAEGTSTTSSSSTGTTSRPFSEIASTITLEGRTWGIVEVGEEGNGMLNELATQVTQRRREWVVLTNMGASVLVRQRPVDTLLGVLQGGMGEIGVFFESCVPRFFTARMLELR